MYKNIVLSLSNYSSFINRSPDTTADRRTNASTSLVKKRQGLRNRAVWKIIFFLMWFATIENWCATLYADCRFIF